MIPEKMIVHRGSSCLPKLITITVLLYDFSTKNDDFVIQKVPVRSPDKSAWLKTTFFLNQSICCDDIYTLNDFTNANMKIISF